MVAYPIAPSLLPPAADDCANVLTMALQAETWGARSHDAHNYVQLRPVINIMVVLACLM